MAIKISTLESYADKLMKSAVAATLTEAHDLNQATAFLCHSHKDKKLVEGVQKLLLSYGWTVYIDWQDNSLPEKPDQVTALKIKESIDNAEWFLFLATPNSTASRWCPWEIGFADSSKGSKKILIIPTEADNGYTYGSEYLQLYKHLDHSTNLKSGAEGVAIFSPNKTTGRHISSLNIL
ncbi:MAG: hypothetical protein CMP47_13075 [Rickettsiales bacterium]|nr:hypothetical protein [Rickettsiales bacterium]